MRFDGRSEIRDSSSEIRFENARFGLRDPRNRNSIEIRDSRSEIRDPRFENILCIYIYIQKTRSEFREIRDSIRVFELRERFEIQEIPRPENRNARPELPDPRSEMRDPRFRSELRDLRSEIPYSRSEILYPRFEIRDLCQVLSRVKGKRERERDGPETERKRRQ